jgi:hypothetical protein
MDGAIPEQTVCNAGLAAATGVGFTIITTVFETPAQPFADGVMV